MTSNLPANHLALDFESYYDTSLSLAKMGVQEYLAKTEVYLVSAYDGNGTARACAPHEFDWSLLHDRLVVSHNANFDAQVFTHLQAAGVIDPSIRPKEWNCTANLAAFLGSPRSLDRACQWFFDLPVSKDIRKRLRGKHWADLDPIRQADVEAYALNDSKLCWQIWHTYSDQWPQKERTFSLLTLAMCAQGVLIDTERLEEARNSLAAQKTEALDDIPWRPPLSMDEFRKACARTGITPPKSLAIGNEECDFWLETFASRYPWVNAMRNYRRCNTLNARIDKMLSRRRPSDGRMPFELKYWGSHTGRDSGSGGVNMQNLPHGELYGVDLRSTIIAPPGYKLVIADLAQIEARILLTLAEDKAQLDMVRAGQSPYEAHARSTMNYTEPVLDKKSPIYRLAKARVLALGYSAGWRKFNAMAYMPLYLGKDAARVFSAPVKRTEIAAFIEYLDKYEHDKATKEKWRNRTPALEREWTNAWLIVQAFRQSNPKIVRCWAWAQKELEKGVVDKYSHFVLKTGRKLRYDKIEHSEKDGITAEIVRDGKQVQTKVYGGKVIENIVQATARDVFMEACLRVAEAGYQIIMRVHDELVAEVPEAHAEEARAHIEALMSVSPTWLTDCPIGAEAKITQRYLK